MDVRVEGSLLVHADCVMGSLESPHEAAARSRHFDNDIFISHPDGRQTVYTGRAEPSKQQQDGAVLSVGPGRGQALLDEDTSSTVVPFPRDTPESQRLVYSDRFASSAAKICDELLIAVVSCNYGLHFSSAVLRRAGHPFGWCIRLALINGKHSGGALLVCRCGRVRLTGVVVRNAGIDWSDASNCYWQHKVARKEAARISLHGQSEFEASHVVLEGDQTFEVGTRHAVELCLARPLNISLVYQGCICCSFSQAACSLFVPISCLMSSLLRCCTLFKLKAVGGCRCLTGTKWWCHVRRLVACVVRCSLCTSADHHGSGSMTWMRKGASG